jgi:hypothetical protein
MNRRKWKEREGEMMDDLPLLDSQESGNIMYRAKINCVLNNIF